jgi:flagellar protein FlaJ
MTDDQEANKRIQSRKKPRVRKPVIKDNTSSGDQSRPDKNPSLNKGTEEGMIPLLDSGHEPSHEDAKENIPKNTASTEPLSSQAREESDKALKVPPLVMEEQEASALTEEPEPEAEAVISAKKISRQEKKEAKAETRRKKKAKQEPVDKVLLPATTGADQIMPAETDKKGKGFSIFRFSKKNDSIQRAKEEIEENQRRLFGVRKKPDQVSIQKMTMTISRKSGFVEPTTTMPKVPGYMKVALTLFRDYYTLKPVNIKLEESLRKSKKPYSPVQYLSMITFFALIAGFGGMIALGVAYYFVGTIALFGIPIVVIVAIMIYSLGIAMPSSAISKRRKNIDTRLPMALAYIATMASADVPVENIMYELGRSPQYGEVAKEARTISASSRLFGNDIVTALREEAKYSPSLKFAEFLSGITSTVTSGGNLKDYFTMKAKQFQSELSTLIKQNSESVGVLAESYVTVGVAFPLMMIVILGILAAISSSAGAVVTVLYLIVLMMVPMITFVFAFLIQSTIKEVNI